MSVTGGFTLALLRHAKSAYPDGVVDYRRPLAERGRREAEIAGQLLKERVGTPDRVLVSGAARTRETWELVSRAFGHPIPADFDDRIYEASVDDLFLVLRSLDGQPRTVVVVGHNPGLEDLAFVLSDGKGDTDAERRMATKFPTSALAVLRCDVAWRHLVAGHAHLQSFDVARPG